MVRAIVKELGANGKWVRIFAENNPTSFPGSLLFPFPGGEALKLG